MTDAMQTKADWFTEAAQEAGKLSEEVADFFLAVADWEGPDTAPGMMAELRTMTRQGLAYAVDYLRRAEIAFEDHEVPEALAATVHRLKVEVAAEMHHREGNRVPGDEPPTPGPM